MSGRTQRTRRRRIMLIIVCWEKFFNLYLLLLFPFMSPNLIPAETNKQRCKQTKIKKSSAFGNRILLTNWNRIITWDAVCIIYAVVFSSVQFSDSVVSNSLWPHESQHTRPPCPSPTPGVYSNTCPSSQWCHPAISSCRPLLLLPPISPSIRVFSNESTLCMRWPRYCSFSFSISPSNLRPGLISFRMDRLDLLAVQGTLKSLLQHHSSKASIFQHSAFFTVQLSHPYMTTGKTIALTRRTFVGKVMSLLF